MAAHIIFVPYLDGFGGVERLVLTLSRHLHDEGQAHLVLSFRNSMDLAAYADWPVRVVELAPRRNPVAETMALRSWLARYNAADRGDAAMLAFDLKGGFYAGLCDQPFVLHLTDPPSLLAGDISKNAPSLRGSPGVEASSPSNFLRLARSELVHRLNSRGVRRARSVIAMTERIASEIRMLYGVEARVIRPGVPDALTMGDSRPNPARPRILSVSRLEDTKRIDWVLEALADLESAREHLSSRFDWRLDVVGTGPSLEGLRALAVRAGIAKRVTFHGSLSDAELDLLFGEAALFVMPAVQGYGLPALEALQRRVPVIMHESSGVAEVLSGTPWVEIVSDPAGADIAPAILRMLEKSIQGGLSTQPPPLPSATQWALEIRAACDLTGQETRAME